MKSSFVPTPPKVGSIFSPEPKMNVTTTLVERQANTGVVVPISTEKKRKIESTGGYFKRMGSPSFGTQKENIHPHHAEKQRVSNLKAILVSSCMFDFHKFVFSQMLRFIHPFTISGTHMKCLPLVSLPTPGCQEKTHTLSLDQEDRDRVTSLVPLKQRHLLPHTTHLVIMKICLCIISHRLARCLTLEVQCSRSLDLMLMDLCLTVKHGNERWKGKGFCIISRGVAKK